MNDPHSQPGREQAEHGHVAELVHAVDVAAPETLHRRVQEMVAARVSPPERALSGAFGGFGARLKPTFAAMALAAVVGAAIALLTGGGTRAPQPGPSVSAASRLTLSAATMSAPEENPSHAAQLDVAVDGVAFPYWKERLGWRASGARTDMLAGRRVTTVYYSGPGDSRVGYAIVGGTPAPGARGGTVSWRDGVKYRLLREHGKPVVTWQRGGRLCVLSGTGVSGATLVRLASWDDDGDDGPAVS